MNLMRRFLLLVAVLMPAEIAVYLIWGKGLHWVVWIGFCAGAVYSELLRSTANPGGNRE